MREANELALTAMKCAFYQGKVEKIRVRGDDIVIGDRSWPKNLRVKWSHSKTLETVLTAMRMSSSGHWKKKVQGSSTKRASKRKREESTAVVTQSSDLLSLPDEILMQIFKYLTLPELLNRTSLVCKRFKNIASDSSLWTELSLPMDRTQKLSPSAAEKLIESCPKLKVLRLGNRRGSGALALKALQCCPLLEELLEVRDYTPSVVRSLLPAIKKSATLRSVGMKNIKDREFVKSRVDCLANLTKIALEPLPVGLLVAIGAGCQKLEHFSGGSYFDVRDVEFNAFIDLVKDRLMSLRMISFDLTDDSCENIGKCSLLQTVEISSYDFGGRGLRSLAGLPDLKHLILKDCHNALSSADVEEVFGGGMFKGLEELRLQRLGKLRNSSVIAIVDNCPELRMVELFGCYRVDRPTVRHLMQKCVKLEHLLLDSMPGLEEEEGATLAEVFEDAKAPLKVLELGEFDLQKVQESKERIGACLPGLQKLEYFTYAEDDKIRVSLI